MSGTRERTYLDAAKRAGMAVPDDSRHYDMNAFPHYHAFATIQRAIPKARKKAICANAKVVAAVSREDVMTRYGLWHYVGLGFDVSDYDKKRR